MRQSWRLKSSRIRGATVIDALVGTVLLLAAACLLVPALAWGDEENVLTRCLDNARGMAAALQAYAADHDGRMPGDLRDDNPADDWDNIRVIPDSELGYSLSWFALAEGYLPADPADLDCPIVDDQRKGEWWQTDYVINRWGIGRSPEIAAQPAKAVLVSEPNMQRGSITILADVIAWSDWGQRLDLEQNQVGSISFVFVDGHGQRVTVAEGLSPHLSVYSDIYMAQPADADYLSNWLWWTPDQALHYGQ